MEKKIYIIQDIPGTLDMVHTRIRCFKRALQQAVEDPLHKHSPSTHILCTKTLNKMEKKIL